MATMTEKELREIYDNASGIVGFIDVAKGVARYFREGEFNNEFTPTYTCVRWCLEELSTTPKFFNCESDEIDHSATYTDAEVDRILVALSDLAESMKKWSFDNEPYEYDVTNEPVEKIFALIQKLFCQQTDMTMSDRCKKAFFLALSSSGETVSYQYRAPFFKQLTEVSPDYDELIDPDAMTKRNETAARHEYSEKLQTLANRLNYREPFDKALSDIKSQRSKMDAGVISRFDARSGIGFLSYIDDVLKFSPYIFYDEYASNAEEEREYEWESYGDGNIPAHNHTMVPMPERKTQEQIREEFEKYILSGAVVAKKSCSTTYSNWAEAYHLYCSGKVAEAAKKIGEAIPRLFADVSIGYYATRKKILELHVPAIKYSNLSLYAHVGQTSEILKETDDFLAPMLTAIGNRPTKDIYSDKLLTPDEIPMMKIYSPDFCDELILARKALGNIDKTGISYAEELSKIESKWTEFFHAMETAAHGKVEHMTAVRSSRSAFHNLSTAHMDLRCQTGKSDVTSEHIGALRDKFSATLPALSAVLSELIQSKPSEAQKVVIAGMTDQGKKDMRQATTKTGRPPKIKFSFTQKQIGLMFGVTTTTVGNWEKGRAKAPKGYSRTIREEGDLLKLIASVDEYNHLKDFKDVLNTKGIIRDGFNEEEIAAINCVIQEWLRAKRRGENVLQTIREA